MPLEQSESSNSIFMCCWNAGISQEILDQIADIDLVVNFKCTEEHLMKKHLATGTYSSCRDFHSMSNAGSNLNQHLQDDQLKSSTADIGGSWKEKLCIYAEQVASYFFWIGSCLMISALFWLSIITLLLLK